MSSGRAPIETRPPGGRPPPAGPVRHFGSVERLPLYRQLQELICSYIGENHLKAGDPLPAEGELAELFGVSRNSIREAVKSLQVLGVLVSRPGSGLFVRRFSFDPIVDSLPYAMLEDCRDLADLLEVRRTLEVGMAERIIAARTDAQVERLGEIVGQWRAELAEHRDAYPAELDRAFHETLAEELQNSLFSKLLDMFWQVFYRASAREELVAPRNPAATLACHIPILDALRKADSEALVRSLGAHSRGIDRRVKAAQKTATRAARAAR
ncbi:MAG TPA: FCD domain-containing protein [Acidimicrobiales bacterium]|nr:FCD domain-containing protein [Acidimicrobiales bacterium]